MRITIFFILFTIALMINVSAIAHTSKKSDLSFCYFSPIRGASGIFNNKMGVDLKGKLLQSPTEFDRDWKHVAVGLSSYSPSTFATTLTNNSWQTLGLNNLAISNKSAAIYPNPYKSGLLSINLKGFETTTKTKVTIRNLIGQTIFQTQLNDSNSTELDLSGKLNKSVYLVSIESGTTQIIKKLIVQ